MPHAQEAARFVVVLHDIIHRALTANIFWKFKASFFFLITFHFQRNLGNLRSLRRELQLLLPLEAIDLARLDRLRMLCVFLRLTRCRPILLLMAKKDGSLV